MCIRPKINSCLSTVAMQPFKVVVFLFIICILNVETARILASFPTPSISHQLAFRPIVHELAKRGHDVTVITTDPAFPKDKAPANLTEIDVHDFSYADFQGLAERIQGNKYSMFFDFTLIYSTFAKVFEKQLQVPEVQKLLDQKFDLVLMEAHVRPVLALGYHFKAPVIQISSLGIGPYVYDQLGAPYHPLLYPSQLSQRLYNLTYVEKIQEFLKNAISEYLVSTIVDIEYKSIRTIFGNDVPDYKELEKNVQLLLLNEHPIWADNHPVPPNIVYIGGIHQTPSKELPKEFKTILDNSKNGTIYVSFGSNVKPSFLPPEKIAVMFNVLSQLPYDVLWKWDSDVLPGHSHNIKFYKWFPQSDLLRHPNIKLFITQGGIQSADETINAGVPVIGIPMFGDQWYNVEKYVRHGVGLQLDIHDLNENNFKNAVETVLNNTSFKNNMLRLRGLLRAHPIPPIELAVWWVEHVLQYGGQHLRSPAAGLTWTQYYEVPLVLTVIVSLIILLFILLRILLLAVKSIKSLVSKDVKSKQKLN